MDQYHGHGGSYVLDPATGERVPLEQLTAEPQPRRRARTAKGKFRGDDPATPDTNEAWQ